MVRALVFTQPLVAVPSFDGKGESFQDCAMGVESWSLVTSLKARKRAPSRVPPMDVTGRDGYMAIENQNSLEPFVAGTFSHLLRSYFAPDPKDAANQGAGQFSHLRNSPPPMGEYLVELDFLRCKAERRLQRGGAFPDFFVAFV